MIALIYISQALQILGNNYFIDGSVKALIELDSTSCFAVTFIVSILITSCAMIDNSHLANLKPERILCTMQRWHQVIHNTKYSLSWRNIISDSSRKFTLIFPWDFKFQAKKNYSQEYWLSLRHLLFTYVTYLLEVLLWLAVTSASASMSTHYSFRFRGTRFSKVSNKFYTCTCISFNDSTNIGTQ